MCISFRTIVIAVIATGLLTLQSCEKENAVDDNNQIKPEWVKVPGGRFEMGCTAEQSNCNDDETPVHSVTINTFEITRYEITNAQYAVFLNDIECNANGSYNDETHGNTEYIDMDGSDCQIVYNGEEFTAESGKGNYPVVEVSWFGAQAFAEWAGGRLPTEAEWEFAARGGKQSQGYKYSGSNSLDDVAWWMENSDKEGNSGLYDGHGTFSVGQKQPNELGIYDMSGNVEEWCHDWYFEDYYSSSPENNPQGPASGCLRVLRGGSWSTGSGYCRVSFRYGLNPVGTNGRFGFRVVR